MTDFTPALSFATNPHLAPMVLSRDARPRFGQDESGLAPATLGVWKALSVAGMGLAAYHGYKRDNSVGWAIWWGLMGGLFPIITVPVALAQGFGKRA